jgi:NACHT N-terminal Helical domain 2
MIESLIPIFGAAAPSFLGRTAASLVQRKLGQAWSDRKERKKAEAAYREAIETWLVALVRNLEALALDEAEIRLFFADYIAALERFLADEEVSDELLRPFSEATPEPRLDHARLLARWQALELPDLPEDFNAAGVCRAYVKELNRQRIVTEELRARHQAQIQEHQRDLLQQLVGPRTALDLTQYARAVRQRYQTLDLSALAPAGRDDPDAAPLRLRDVFIPQHARRSRPVYTLPRDYLVRQRFDPDKEEERAAVIQKSWREAKREPALDLLSAENAQHSVLLGDPGAGKSSLARYVLLSLLNETPASVAELPPWRERLRGYLPILVELRRYIAREAEGKCKGFLAYLDYLGHEQGFALNATDLHALLSGEPTLVIFDGLDEVFDPKVRERIASEIAGFALRYRPARVLVTSRIMGFDAHPFEEASFEIVTLDDLNNEQIKAFSEGWFRVAFSSRPEEANRRHRHVMDTLKERPAIRALAGNPLLLTIVAIIARHEQLPHSRVGLYEHALKVLCHNWDLRRHVELLVDSPLRDLDADHKLTLLRRIAWQMQEGAGLKANAIEQNDLKEEIERYFADEWQFDLAKRRRCAREMIELLQNRNYIICPQGPALFGSIHRTFLEYLCAAHLLWRFKDAQNLTLNEIRDNYVAPRAEEDSWREIIRLLSTQLQPHQAASIIEVLISPSSNTQQDGSRLALAFECLV